MQAADDVARSSAPQKRRAWSPEYALGLGQLIDNQSYRIERKRNILRLCDITCSPILMARPTIRRHRHTTSGIYGTHRHTRKHACMHACTHACTHARTHMYMYTCTVDWSETEVTILGSVKPLYELFVFLQCAHTKEGAHLRLYVQELIFVPHACLHNENNNDD